MHKLDKIGIQDKYLFKNLHQYQFISLHVNWNEGTYLFLSAGSYKYNLILQLTYLHIALVLVFRNIVIL